MMTRMPASVYACRHASGNFVLPGSTKHTVPFFTSSTRPSSVVAYSSSSVIAVWSLNTWLRGLPRSSGKMPRTACA